MLWIFLAVAAVIVLLILVRVIVVRGSLHASARAGYLSRVQSILARWPDRVNQRDHTGETPLHHAARFGDINIITFLLDRGADPNARSLENVTALHYLAAFNFPEAIRLLLTRGAEPDPIEATGITPLMAAMNAGHEQVVDILKAAGADPDRPPPVLLQDTQRSAAFVPSDAQLAFAKQHARSTLSDFQNLALDDPHNALIKFPFTTDAGDVEHVWGRVVSFSPEIIAVTLVSKPIAHSGKLPRRLDVPLADLEDWQYCQPDNTIRGSFTNFVIWRELERRNGKLPKEIFTEIPRYLDRDAFLAQLPQ